MIEKLSKFVGFLLASFGLYQLYEFVAMQLGNQLSGLFVVLSVFSVWGAYQFIQNVFNPFVYKYFNVKPLSDALITSIKIELCINEAGEAVSNSWRTFVFRHSPKKWETYDTLFVKGRFTGNINEYYQSNDSDVDTYKKLTKNKILVYWQPKLNEIKPFVPYTHHYTFIPPSNFSDDTNFYLLYKICPVGTYDFRVKAHRKVKEAWAIEISKHHDKIDEQSANKLVVECSEFSVPQPVVTNDGFVWSGESDQFSQPILIYFSYESDGSNKSSQQDASIAGTSA